MRRITYISTFLMLLVAFSLRAQDQHFSQYFAAPLLINPAETGNFAEDYRVGGNLKQQWPWANNAKRYNYLTVSAYADFTLLHDILPKGDWLGAGLVLLNDNAGTGNLSTTKIFGSVAYHKMLGLQRRYYLSIGVNAGYVQKGVDFDKLYFDKQWNDLFFDTGLPSGESGSQKLHYFDMAAGINFTMKPRDNMVYSFGFSMNHIVQPNESFYKNTNRLGVRPVANICANIRLSPHWHLEPSVAYENERSASEILGALLAGYHIGKDNKDKRGATIAYFGLIYRGNDALAPVVGAQIARVKVLLNYDINLSTLTTASKAVGGFEMSVVYKGYWPNSLEERSIPCPRF